MLKIRDDINLKELEKYGFKKEKDYIINDYLSYVCHSTRIWFSNRKIVKHDAHFGECDMDLLYDLIKADLVEKVGDK